jgi:transposase
MPKGRKQPSERRRLACSLLDQGCTVAEAARVAGVPESSVANWAAQMGRQGPQLWDESRGRIPPEPEPEPVLEPEHEHEPEPEWIESEEQWRALARRTGRGGGAVSDGPPEARYDDATGLPRHERRGGRDER